MSGAGPAAFLLACLVVFAAGAGAAVALRLRGQRRRWAGWQALAAARGLQAVDGDPLGVGPALSGSVTSRSVQRTLSGTVDGMFVAVVLTVGLSGSPRYRSTRSDLYALARVGEPVPVDRLRLALKDVPGVRVGALGDMVLLQSLRGLRPSVDVPPPEEASRLLDLASWAGRTALA